MPRALLKANCLGGNHMEEPKVVRYGPETIKRHTAPSWETVAAELLVVFFLLSFAYMGYRAKLALLLIPCAIGAAVILATMVYQLWSAKTSNKVGP